MPRGARPGERRGGRKRETPNKATCERVLLAKRVLEEQQGKPGRKRAREVLDDLMHICVGMAAKYQPLAYGAVPMSGQVPDEVVSAVCATRGRYRRTLGAIPVAQAKGRSGEPGSSVRSEFAEGGRAVGNQTAYRQSASTFWARMRILALNGQKGRFGA
jgi:hypothetical protein